MKVLRTPSNRCEQILAIIANPSASESEFFAKFSLCLGAGGISEAEVSEKTWTLRSFLAAPEVKLMTTSSRSSCCGVAVTHCTWTGCTMENRHTWRGQTRLHGRTSYLFQIYPLTSFFFCVINLKTLTTSDGSPCSLISLSLMYVGKSATLHKSKLCEMIKS
jgi:hypothetical protein